MYTYEAPSIFYSFVVCVCVWITDKFVPLILLENTERRVSNVHYLLTPL